jgi:hypothetical protein
MALFSKRLSLRDVVTDLGLKIENNADLLMDLIIKY